MRGEPGQRKRGLEVGRKVRKVGFDVSMGILSVMIGWIEIGKERHIHKNMH